MKQNINIIAPITDNGYHSIESIAEKLKYFSRPFPQATVEEAITHKNEITPKLLEYLDYAYKHHSTLDEDYMGHTYALFLLAEFKEKRAFTTVMNILELPEESLDLLLGDCLTEGYAKIITSVYNGDLAAIKRVIENPNNNLYARISAIKGLIGLVKVSVLDQDEIIQYIASLFLVENFRSDPTLMAFLVDSACHLQSDSLYDAIKESFRLNLIDEEIINLNDVEHFKSKIHDSDVNEHNIGYIDSAIDSMSWWYCFKEDEQFIPQIPVVRGVKIGRNDPCPCGSGRKYKKCCGSNL
jgi:hypothetical protein